MRFTRLIERLLAFEICAVVSVYLIFSYIENRLTAALLASQIFITLGLWIFFLGMSREEFRKSLTFKVGLVHLFIISLPMFIARIFSLGGNWSQAHVWGIPGPVFHHIAEGVYLILIFATLTDRCITKAN
jgi:hypothetical protein